jgi:hypothetical protein
MDNPQLNLGQLNLLVGVAGLDLVKVPAAATAFGRFDINAFGRIEQLLPMSFMTLLAAGLSFCIFFLAIGLVERRIGRRRLI